MEKIAIIGAGQAGANAALKLRENGFIGGIDLYGEEVYEPYERPELSKSYALGKAPFEKLILLTKQKAEEQKIELKLAQTVTGVSLGDFSIETDISRESYHRVIFATGGRARTLPVFDDFPAPVLTIRNKADSDLLHTSLESAKTIAILGGGWLGLELAATCREAGCETHVFEAADRLCARVAPVWLSGKLQELHRSQGVMLHLGTMPTISSNGRIEANGASVLPDLVLVAIGMIANDTLAEQAGLACEDGIIVDEMGQTQITGVYAIGDCARYTHRGNQRLESWQNANYSAEAAIRHILGMEPMTAAADWFWSKQFAANVQMLGTCSDIFHQISRVYPSGKGDTRFFIEDGVLKGVIAINAPRDIGQSKRLVETGAYVNSEALSDACTPVPKCRDKVSG